MKTLLHFLFTLATAASLRAATFTVANNADSGAGSLRQALADAGANSEADTITFAAELSGQVITLLPNNALQVDESHGVTIDASALPGGLTITDTGDVGHRLLRVVAGTVEVVAVTFADGGGAAFGNDGGAVQNSGVLTLSRCTIHGGSTAGRGGAVANGATGVLTLVNCTLTGNSTLAAGGHGGAIYHANTAAGSLTIIHCTIAANSAAGDGGGIFAAGPFTLQNSIVGGGNVAAGSGNGIYHDAALTRAGANIIQGRVQGPGGSASGPAAINADPLLLALGNFGGPVKTMHPDTLAGSPAADPVGSDEVPGLTTDQRGYSRYVGTTPDLGAVETAYSLPVTNGADSGPGSLRDMMAVAQAIPGQNELRVAASLTTITLTSEIVVGGFNSVLVNDADVNGGLTLSATGGARHFHITSGSDLSLQRLSLIGGQGGGATLPGFGGAILNTGTVVLTDCTLRGNSAAQEGGAVYSTRDIPDYSYITTIRSCTFTGNSAYEGGAVRSVTSQLSLLSSTLTGNSAVHVGGACSVADGGPAATIVDCTIAGNTAGNWGGGLLVHDKAATISRCIIAGNSALFSGADVNRFGGTLTLLENLIGNNHTIADILPAGPLVGTPTAPLDARLAPLGNYGGPTMTMPPLPGSLAVDAATTASFSADQRGAARSLDGDGDSTAAPDIGAVEMPAPLTVTTAADENDTPAGPARSLREAIRDAPAGATVLFDPALFNGEPPDTIVLTSEIAFTTGVIVDASAVTGGVKVDGGPGSNRIFYLPPGTGAFLRGLTLTGGNGGGASNSGTGGAISCDFATLALTECTLTANNATGAFQTGGAIDNFRGMLTLNQCLLTGNSSAYYGGAIFSTSPALAGPADSPTTLTHCTLTNNSAARGGAHYNNFGRVTFIHCTITGNDAPAGQGSGVASDGDNSTQTVVQNSIIAGNTNNSDVGFVLGVTNSFTSRGGNTIGNGETTAAFNQPGDAIFVPAANIALAPLGDYGGSTQTMPPLAGSVAIDRAAAILGITTDQRGVPYSFDGNASATAEPDSGAVEYIPPGAPLIVAATNDIAPRSLKNMLRIAAFLPGADTITFDPLFNDEPADTITPDSELVVNDADGVTIDASAASGGVTVSGGNAHRVFFQPGGTATMKRLTITAGNGAVGQAGGGILAYGNLTMSDCTITGNTSAQGVGGIAQFAGTLTMQRCTISGNSAPFSGGGQFQGTASLTQCTITGNTAANGPGGVNGLGNVTLTHCTISGNGASFGGGLALQSPGAVTLANSIIAGNTAPSSPDIHKFSGTITGGGTANFIGNNQSVETEFPSSSLVGTSAAPLTPLLAPLGNYGGPTQTMALLPGSPARNFAFGSGITGDQRGFPIVATPDLGAYEAGTFTDFDAWVWETLPATATPAQRAPGFDFDSDGRPLLLEYAGGFSGTVPEAGSPLTFTRNAAGTLATIRVPVRASAAEFSYHIERSTDLATWTPIVHHDGFAFSLLTGGITYMGFDGSGITFTDTFIAGQPKVFYRWKVAQ